MSGGARAHDDPDVKLAACHCVCASSVSSAAFQAKRVPGFEVDMRGLGEKKWSDIILHVEARHRTQGFGDASWNVLRRCGYEYCSKKDQTELCPQNTADVEPVVQFIQKRHFTLQNQAWRMMTVRDTAHEGWGMKDIVQGQQEPVILQHMAC